MRKIYLGNVAPITYKPGQMGEDLEHAEDQPVFETVTEINVSDDSSLFEAVDEIKRIWSIHSHDDKPEWIGYSREAMSLATILADEYSVRDLRPMD